MNDDVDPPAAGEPLRVRGGYFFPVAAARQDSGTPEISLAEIRQTLIARWKLIALSMLLCGGVSTAIAFLITPTFRAEILLAAGDNAGDAASKSGGFSSQLGALASFAGLSSGDNSLDEAIAVLKSRVITDSFVTDNNLLPILFATKWDADNGRWKSTDPKRIPTLWDAYKLIDKFRSVTPDRKTGMISMAITWKDPKLAAEWANELVKRTNLYIRTKAIEHSNANISYLQDQLTKTSMVELRTSLNNVIEQELKKAMMAQGSDEYAFKVIDPAVVPQEKETPKRANYLGGGLLFGFLAGVLIALFRGRPPVRA